MAKQIIAKNIGRQGSTTGNRVVFQITGTETVALADTTFTFDYAQDGTTPPTDNFIMTPRIISAIYNLGGADATVDGKTYGPGVWKLEDIGGIPLTSAGTCAVVGANVIIEFRS